MIQSMTGYGAATGSFNDYKIRIEIRALNGKTSDVRMKLPNKYLAKELFIRKTILTHLKRGKIEITITVDGEIGESYALDENLFRDYHKKLTSLANELGSQNQDFFATIVRIPNVVKAQMEEVTEDEWNFVQALMKEALNQVLTYREKEGLAMYEDIKENNKRIKQLLTKVAPFEEERIGVIKDRINANLDGIIDSANLDQNRFEQEIIYYIEKLDFNEEKVRLEQHCTYFNDILSDESNNGYGKKLIFISQEMGREINTLGAKAQFAPIQQIVVEMKDELKKIKEQLLNVL